MRRLSYLSVPVFVATAALVLAPVTLGAQQPTEKAAAAQASACCGKSGGDAMNHAAGSGCCGNMAAKAGAPADHSEHAEHQAAPAGKAGEAKPMASGAGCCANMNHGTPAKAGEKAAGSCCANMKMDHTAAKTAEGTGGASCCANMKHDASAKADGKAMGACCANMHAKDGATAADPHAGHTADSK